jgi:hypothetical protein
LDFYLAQHINLLCGGAVVAPWEVRFIPERYIDAAIGLNTLKDRKRKLQESQAYIKRTFDNWRKNHPSYKGRR